MDILLGEKWERFIASKVKSGEFRDVSHVLEEGLRLLREKDLLGRVSASSLAQLEQKLLQGVASLDRGEGIDGEEAFKRLRLAGLIRKHRGED